MDREALVLALEDVNFITYDPIRHWCLWADDELVTTVAAPALGGLSMMKTLRELGWKDFGHGAWVKGEYLGEGNVL